MAVPSSGEIKLGGIYSELDQGDYSELNDGGKQLVYKVHPMVLYQP